MDVNDLKWYDPLYTDAGTKKNIRMIRWRLNHGAGSFRIYLITLSTSREMQLDILHASQLKQPYLRRNLPMIVGVAQSYEDARELVIRIIEDVIRKTGNADVRCYFEKSDAEKGADECYI